MSYINRLIPIREKLKKKSVLLLGPRRTGKSSLIREEIKADKVYNLLAADTFQALVTRPSLIREQIVKKNELIVIDEIQKAPGLMDEVHLMIEEHHARFLLTGSSARKLRRTHTSLMAGRAEVMHLMPFCYAELPKFDLTKRLESGSLPPVWLSPDPWDELSSYSGEYLKEEVQAEAFSRNIEGFSRFLIQAGTTNTEILNFESIASDAQVPPRTVREYYAVLVDTLMGTFLEPLPSKKKVSRKAVAKAKFYFFDGGVVNALLRQKSLPTSGDAYGRAFEHFIFQELNTQRCYRGKDRPLNFWGIHSGPEVDFILDESIAIEVKATSLVAEKHLKGLKAFSESNPCKRQIVISRDRAYRKMGKVEVYPYELFLSELWAGEI